MNDAQLFHQSVSDIKPIGISYRDWRSCKDKVPFFSDQEIQKVFDRYPDIHYRVYECDVCFAKHLTKT